MKKNYSQIDGYIPRHLRFKAPVLPSYDEPMIDVVEKVPVSDVKGGAVVSEIVCFKRKKASECHDGLTVEMFKLRNMLASGVPLDVVNMIPVSRMNELNAIASNMSKVDSLIALSRQVDSVVSDDKVSHDKVSDDKVSDNLNVES